MVIVGLGNPGEEYRDTRHNVGFEVVDALANEARVNLKERGCMCLLGEGKIGDRVVILAKPQTYMNRSGVALRLLVDRYCPETYGLIVIYDDVDLPIGQIRIRKRGGSGGHKGLLSIIDYLGSSDFIRVRVGIGAPSDKATLTEYVLSKFEDDEFEPMRKGIEMAVEAVKEIVISGVEEAMNRFN
jgi:PTH1 family peptidyl-tRNA hydrolase